MMELTGLVLGLVLGFLVPWHIPAQFSLYAAAGLLACRIAPGTERFILPPHMSGEPGMGRILRELDKEAFIGCHMKLGEGTGAVALMPLLDMTLEVYRKMPDFDGIQIEAYKPLGGEA